MSDDLEPIPVVRPVPEWQGAAAQRFSPMAPCPICHFVVTLDFKIKRKKRRSIARYSGKCPTHGWFTSDKESLLQSWKELAA